MKKKFVKKGMILVGVITMMTAMTGCTKVTKESLAVKMYESVSKTESFKMDMKMDLKAGGTVSGITVDLKMGMDMGMDMNTEPAVIHGNGALTMNFLGMNEKVNLEMYSMNENGRTVTYTKSGDKGWVKGDEEDSKETEKKGEKEVLLALLKNLNLSEETQDINGITCYELKGSVKGEELNRIWDSAGDLIESNKFMEELELENAELPVEIYISKEDKYPVKMTMDLKELMKETFDSLMKDPESQNENGVGIVEFNCDTCSIELSFSSFGEVGVITVPEDVKKSAAEEEENSDEKSGLDFMDMM